MNTKRIIGVLVALTFVAQTFAVGGDYDYSVNLAPSATAPASNPPMLIVLGSDDNTSAIGMQWIVDYLASKSPANGHTLRMSFYSNTIGWDSATQDIVVAHKNAYADGHEVSNHTESHPYFVTTSGNTVTDRASIAATSAEMQACTDDLNTFAGIALKDMKGFRTPYLAYSDTTFTVAVQKGFTYDCSINGGTTWGSTAGTYYWPYTLNTDDGEGNYSPDNTALYNWWASTFNTPISQHSGYWTIPNNAWVADPVDTAYMSTVFTYDHGGKLTALDYNLWAQAKFNKDQSLRALKKTLDLTFAGNRAPMAIGMHSQYYVDYPEDSAFVNIQSAADRQWVLEQFIDYALAKSNDIYFVSGAQTIEYMMNPVPATSFDPENYQTITGPVTPTNTAPTDVIISANSVTADAAIGTVVGTLSSVDNAGDTHTYTHVSGAGFEVVGNQVRVSGALTGGSVTVRVRTTDQGSLTYEKDLSITVTPAGTGGDFVEVLDMVTWEIGADAIGSNGTAVHDTGVSAVGVINLSTNDTTIVGVDTTIDWAWISLDGYADTSFDAVTDIEVTYTADKAIQMGLSTETYGFGTPLAAGTHTVKVPVSAFTLSWSDAGTPTLDMSAVSGVAFEATESGTTTITITSLKLYGFVPSTATPVSSSRNIVAAQSIKVVGIQAGSMQLAVPTAGRYNISVYSVDGRLLARHTEELVAGASSVALNRSLGKGLAIVQIQGAAGSFSSKIMMR